MRTATVTQRVWLGLALAMAYSTSATLEEVFAGAPHNAIAENPAS